MTCLATLIMPSNLILFLDSFFYIDINLSIDVIIMALKLGFKLTARTQPLYVVLIYLTNK